MTMHDAYGNIVACVRIYGVRSHSTCPGCIRVMLGGVEEWSQNGVETKTVFHDGQWYHFAFTIDEDGATSVYVNGELERSARRQRPLKLRPYIVMAIYSYGL